MLMGILLTLGLGAFLYWLVTRSGPKPEPTVVGYAPVTDRPSRVRDPQRDIPYGLPRTVTTKDGKTYRRIGATTDYISEGYDRNNRNDGDNFLTWFLIWNLLSDDSKADVIAANPAIESFSAGGGDFSGGGATANWTDDKSASSTAAAAAALAIPVVPEPVPEPAEPVAPAYSDRGWDRAPETPVRSEPSTSDYGSRDYSPAPSRDSDYANGSSRDSDHGSRDYGGSSSSGSDYGSSSSSSSDWGSSSSSSSSSGGGYGGD